MQSMSDSVTAAKILDSAERLVQTRGFNAFSYADIATELRLRKASIHYHFPSKADLGRRLLARYEAAFCGMLAADFETLPRGLRDAVKVFFVKNEAWLAKLLDDGRAARSLAFEGSPIDKARSLVSALEGGMLVARSFGDIKRFEALARKLVTDLRAPSKGKA